MSVMKPVSLPTIKYSITVNGSTTITDSIIEAVYKFKQSSKCGDILIIKTL